MTTVQIVTEYPRKKRSDPADVEANRRAEASSKPSGMHESDPAVVARARDGDIDAFRVLVEQHSRYLFGVRLRFTRNTEDTRTSFRISG